MPVSRNDPDYPINKRVLLGRNRISFRGCAPNVGIEEIPDSQDRAMELQVRARAILDRAFRLELARVHPAHRRDVQKWYDAKRQALMRWQSYHEMRLIEKFLSNL